MLRNSSDSSMERPWSASRRWLSGLCLLALTLVVASLRGPARADEKDAPTSATAVATRNNDPTPIDLQYVSRSTLGLVAFRPTALFRHPGLTRFSKPIREALLSELAEVFKIDHSRPDRMTLDLEDVEWAITGLNLGRTKNHDGPKMHTLELSGLTVRTAAPFDWLRFFREWNLKLDEVREGSRVYYRVVAGFPSIPGLIPCVYLPDDRTMAFNAEPEILAMIRRTKPAVPAYLAGADWERASRGLFAVALQTQDDAFAKDYDLGRPDDALVLPLFKGVNHWVFGVDDAETLALHAEAACRDADAGRAIQRSIDSLIKMAIGVLEHDDPAASPSDHRARARRMARTLLANLRVSLEGRSVGVEADRFGTLNDLAAIIESDVAGKNASHADRNVKPNGAKP